MLALLVRAYVPLSASPSCELRSLPCVPNARLGTEVASEQTHGMKPRMTGDPFPSENDICGRVSSVCLPLLPSMLFLISVQLFFSSLWHFVALLIFVALLKQLVPLKEVVFPRNNWLFPPIANR